ncbi:putative phosphoinositide phospholipase C [Helianthus annuus]|nr:putative phosphoinositide phospholipase C [Helianthus annuus]
MEEEHEYYTWLFIFKRKFKISKRKPLPEMIEVFNACTNNESQMSPDHFRRFLIEFQGDQDVTVDYAKQIMEKVLHQLRPDFAQCCFSVDDFFNYLFLDKFNGPIDYKVHHDMTAPLQHYFIYTGHNSYLTGNQLIGGCSVKQIIKSLKKGVRVIELDLWPTSSKEGIHVLHGGTMTTPVELEECLTAIKEHAFVKSPYPVIITLEDHLTPNLRDIVAKMVTEIFGDTLYHPEAGDHNEFPSPEALKHRILLSTKLPKEHLDEINGSREDNISSLNHDLTQLFEIDFEDENEDAANENPGQKTTPGYTQLIGIHAAKPDKKLSKALTVESGKAKRLSLGEQTLERAASLYGTDLVRFTQKNILRVYPKGTRITSTNFKPLRAWMHGVQMVAFNMQGYGKSLWMMHGMFRSNGKCGFVKKPDFLMSMGPNNEVFEPKVPLDVKKTLKVRVYMGDGWRKDFSQTHFDKYSPPDFYTKLYMVGVPADVRKVRTREIIDDWIPIWNQEFSFPLTVPELALLKIVVREHDAGKDDFAGQTCLPVSELKPGIRVVRLRDKKGKKFKSVKLLMKFTLE